MSGNMKILGAAAAVLVLLGVVLGGASLVRAQSPSPTPGKQSGLLADARQKLADNLGVSTDQLDQALKKTASDLIDEAVASGRLTQQQADQLKQRIDQSNNPLGALFALRGRGAELREGLGQREVLNAAAATLNMQPSDLLNELRSGNGKSLADVAQAHNVSVDDLKSGIISHATDDINNAVNSGKLTRQQGDQAIQKLKDNIDSIVTKQFTGCQGGHMGRGGGMKGMPFANPSPSQPNQSPTPGQSSGLFRRFRGMFSNQF